MTIESKEQLEAQIAELTRLADFGDTLGNTPLVQHHVRNLRDGIDTLRSRLAALGAEPDPRWREAALLFFRDMPKFCNLSVDEIERGLRLVVPSLAATGCKPAVLPRSVLEIVAGAINEAYANWALNHAQTAMLDTLRQNIANRLAAEGVCTYDEFSDACRVIR